MGMKSDSKLLFLDVRFCYSKSKLKASLNNGATGSLIF